MTRNTKHKMKRLMAAGVCRNVAEFVARQAAQSDGGTLGFGRIWKYLVVLAVADDCEFLVNVQGRIVWYHKGRAFRVCSASGLDSELRDDRIRSESISGESISLGDMRNGC